MMTGDNDDARNRDEDDSLTCSLSSPHLRGLARRLSSGHGQDIDT